MSTEQGPKQQGQTNIRTSGRNSRDDQKDPDAILRGIAQDEKKNREGKLRVFLGMSAGVGKTYAMLKAAHQRVKEGMDVVVGVVETHRRVETAALVEGLNVIPLLSIEYRGSQLQEMDIDAILKRHPRLVVVDELAHSNIPGSRHAKRYQDVLELLDAGIDVYTSLNVQHLESRKDAVEAITGIPIRETVPDSLLERATLVELVDIAPTELLKRLKEGKVYLGDKAHRAAENFFKEDRLTALREIALRMTAERVDQDLQKMGGAREGFGESSGPWQTNERLLVAISHSPYSERLIRATRRLAYSLEAPWIAVHVDTGIALNDVDQAQLVKNLNLARELKAEVIATTETNVPAAIRRICRTKNVTQVLVGRPTRRWLRDIFDGGSLLDRLVRESFEVDVHVIRQERPETASTEAFQLLSQRHLQMGLTKYWFTFCFMALISLVSAFAESFIGYRAVGFIFLLAVLFVGLFGSISAVFFSAVMSAFVWIYFFIPPRMTFVINSADDLILCITFFIAALITGFLANRLRFHEKIIREREERTNFLYEILQDIANSQEKSEFLEKVTSRVGLFMKAECGVILKNKANELQFDEALGYGIKLAEKDRAVAQWSFQNQKKAGWSTDTLAQSKALYLPLRGHNESVGIFVFQPLKKVRKFDLEQESLLLSIVQQLGISIERSFLVKRLNEAQRLKDSEELHQTLLNSISHEMRTPLTAILGMAASLENPALVADKDYLKSVSENLQEAGDRLNRVIENLLDMSRLNSGALSLKLEWHDFNDLVGVVIEKNAKNLAKHILKVSDFEGLALVKMDFRLMEHALSNLLLNASIYSPAGSTIQIDLKREKEKVIFEIKDQGPGVPEESISRLFDKFYRVPGSPTGGTGLGLSIVKSIVELHKGRVFYENQVPHGALFRVELPLGEAPELPQEGRV